MKDAIFLAKKAWGNKINIVLAFSKTEKGLDGEGGGVKLTIISASQVL